jgi:hypothetical protein
MEEASWASAHGVLAKSINRAASMPERNVEQTEPKRGGQKKTNMKYHRAKKTRKNEKKRCRREYAGCGG